MAGTSDYLEFNVSISTSGIYPISFRYSQGSTSYNGNRKLQLQVNGNIVKSAYDFLYTRSSSYWMYTDMFDVAFNAGYNTVKVVVVDQNGGPNIDHLRIGKPPAVVMKSEFLFCFVSSSRLVLSSTISSRPSLLSRSHSSRFFSPSNIIILLCSFPAAAAAAAISLIYSFSQWLATCDCQEWHTTP